MVSVSRRECPPSDRMIQEYVGRLLSDIYILYTLIFLCTFKYLRMRNMFVSVTRYRRKK